MSSTLQIQNKSCLKTFFCNNHEEEKKYDNAIGEFTRGVFVDFGMNVLSTAVSLPFVATSGIPILLAGSVGLLAVGIFLRASGVLFKVMLPSHRYADRFVGGLPMVTTGIFPAMTSGVVVHEAGHYYAGKLVWKNLRPSIELNFPTGGVTKFFGRYKTLTEWGLKFGDTKSENLMVVAGPLSSVALAIFCLIAAHTLRNKQPEVSQHLRSVAIWTTFNTVGYALEALTLKAFKPSHDFMHLSKFANIHPLTAAITAIAVPLLTQLVLSGSSYAYEKWKERKISSKQ